MARLLLRWLLSALALIGITYLVPGIHVSGFLVALVAALVIGIVNALVRPLLVLLTLPVTVLTLGLFLLVINAILFGMAAWLVPGFTVDGVGAALIGSQGRWLPVPAVWHHSPSGAGYLGPAPRRKTPMSQDHPRPHQEVPQARQAPRLAYGLERITEPTFAHRVLAPDRARGGSGGGGSPKGVPLPGLQAARQGLTPLPGGVGCPLGREPRRRSAASNAVCAPTM